MQHPLEKNHEARELAARFMARANKGALAAFRTGIELSTGSLPTYLERTLPRRADAAQQAERVAAEMGWRESA